MEKGNRANRDSPETRTRAARMLFDNRRMPQPIGNIPTAEAEEKCDEPNGMFDKVA